MPHAEPSDRIRSSGVALVRLAKSYASASEVRYLAPPAPARRTSDRIVSKGALSRPTEDIALDERRLRLSAVVVTAELELERIAHEGQRLASALEAAVDDWAGLRA